MTQNEHGNNHGHGEETLPERAERAVQPASEQHQGLTVNKFFADTAAYLSKRD